ncbi:MAG: membrane lipoprotein lipid attachment site-containing protein [Alistipes sp.]|nr:membrane lipoprotein lipid attachment site-containing protein [Alistipes sp.]
MKKILFAIVSIFALAACVKEELPQSQQQIADGDKVTLTFGVKVPEAGSATRAMGDDNEEISRLDVIVFDNAGYFVDAVQATAVATDVPYDSNTMTFKVELNSASRERRIHFVANADPAQIAAIKGHEDAAISSLVVSGTTDAYWQRMVYGGIGVDSDDFTAPADFFGKDTRVIPLVRNYAKITVTDNNADDAFELTGYKVFNTRSQGSVAAYDEKVGQFVDFSKALAEGSDKLFAAKSYSELSNYTPLEKGELTSSAYTTAPTYVRETSKDSPYIIIQGTYDGGEPVYYKLDFILDGVGGKANILRNFEYNFVINAVTKKGTDEETAKNQTSGENGLSFDAGTQSLLNISDGVGQLFVNATTVVLVDNKPYDLKYKYIPDITSPNTTGNDQIKLTGFSGGKVIDTYTPTTTEGIATVDGWSTITITPKALPTAGFETQDVILSTSSGLARTVKFILMQPYAMSVNAYDGGNTQINKEDKEVDAALNEDVWVDVAIPNNVDASLFPLEFVFETVKNSLSPDASANTMPVRTGESIIPGPDAEANTFGFVYTLTKSAYDACTTDANGNKVFTAKFKTSKQASATTVYVYNPYFALGSDLFRNPRASYTYDIEAVLGANAAVYGADHDVTLDITLPEAPAGVNVSVETTGFDNTQTRATGTYTTDENGQVKLTMKTTEWAGTRSVTVSCASQQPINNGWDNITYNAKTVSVTPNKLMIPAGSFMATPVPTGAVSVKVGSTTASETITFNADGTNNAATVTIPGLSESGAEAMTLSYTNASGVPYAASTTVAAAKSVETDNISFEVAYVETLNINNITVTGLGNNSQRTIYIYSDDDYADANKLGNANGYNVYNNYKLSNSSIDISGKNLTATSVIYFRFSRSGSYRYAKATVAEINSGNITLNFTTSL